MKTLGAVVLIASAAAAAPVFKAGDDRLWSAKGGECGDPKVSRYVQATFSAENARGLLEAGSALIVTVACSSGSQRIAFLNADGKTFAFDADAKTLKQAASIESVFCRVDPGDSMKVSITRTGVPLELLASLKASVTAGADALKAAGGVPATVSTIVSPLVVGLLEFVAKPSTTVFRDEVFTRAPSVMGACLSTGLAFLSADERFDASRANQLLLEVRAGRAEVGAGTRIAAYDKPAVTIELVVGRLPARSLGAAREQWDSYEWRTSQAAPSLEGHVLSASDRRPVEAIATALKAAHDERTQGPDLRAERVAELKRQLAAACSSSSLPVESVPCQTLARTITSIETAPLPNGCAEVASAMVSLAALVPDVHDTCAAQGLRHAPQYLSVKQSVSTCAAAATLKQRFVTLEAAIDSATTACLETRTRNWSGTDEESKGLRITMLSRWPLATGGRLPVNLQPGLATGGALALLGNLTSGLEADPVVERVTLAVNEWLRTVGERTRIALGFARENVFEFRAATRHLLCDSAVRAAFERAVARRAVKLLEDGTIERDRTPVLDAVLSLAAKATPSCEDPELQKLEPT